ncbi:hypothetical protein O0L34_g6449 [Tuta absoluta]|nr:hypothetical protein O0L34_g6449 [Tuta absoluta]
MLKIIICLAVLAGVYCANETRKKFDPVVKKIEDEFPGYKGRPMPKELQDMITVHKKMNDDIEECMYDFSECMAVHKSYPFCGLQIASAKTNTTQNVTKWFKNLCDFAYRLCRDGENSWISLPNSECSHLEPITEAEQSKFYDQDT